ncbi:MULTISPECIES: hypothetical protein [Streptomyces]|uniref:Uncharacterized protein n=1 Tax=Streptomyces sudanensis TaxID=436397 RepID=A0ABY4TD64_9ACTN|nr:MULTISPECIES: hypothetical protein [Streptomyces]MCP9987552.1 hypothetical protein [Streptomyces sudanensis]MCQ0001066.1 hypothetical protein [Streptomyces sudanensis]URN16657.1 hypothetical protein MW084_12690 [Streptomyces sudanensis]
MFVQVYRFKDSGEPFLLCSECDAFWWPDDVVGGGTARLLDDVVAARLGVARDAVWAGRARADVLEPQE